ncbi:uncharacterized protein LOC141915336 [Tubulanus polymorphus]|uniref:uncharacterized protein LOC141915336 n=1 Tax=Tubulanus polymorphus TaxID=672921 RepID=UPI003DA64215
MAITVTQPPVTPGVTQPTETPGVTQPPVTPGVTQPPIIPPEEFNTAHAVGVRFRGLGVEARFIKIKAEGDSKKTPPVITMSSVLGCYEPKEDVKENTSPTEMPTCNPEQMTCTDGTSCGYLCNGVIECADGTDEENCTTPIPTCSDDEFTCKSGKCLSKNITCDNYCDCFECEDEDVPINCTEPCNNKTETPIRNCVVGGAFSFKCLPKEKICDGINDCQNGIDEKNCESTTTNGQFIH